MAEIAPLTSAHSHARRAAEELRQSHSVYAAEQHQQASTDFARAAKGTSDAEALRVLKLLEEQHYRLAQIVKSKDSTVTESIAPAVKPVELSSKTKDAANVSPPPEKATTPKTRTTPSSLANTRVGSQARDSSPSLAREIASRRGIPQTGRTQQSPAAQARARQLSPESKRRSTPAAAPKVPRSVVDSQADIREAAKAKKAQDDEGFSKFYSGLTNGTMSKLSSVLAYAGLPLTAEDAAQLDQSTIKKPEKRTVRASNEPDVKKIFSKAALEAIEDEHRRRGTLGHGFGPAESFYVVQRGGGTYSYADIARAQQSQLSGIGEEDDAEFVDAREVPGPASPVRSRFSQQKRSSFGKTRTQEELELENTTLKTTLEQLASRLAAFEVHAQDASMAALTQSMASLRQAPSGGGDQGMQERLRQLERQVEKEAEERQKLESLAQRQQKALKKWDVRYDELKRGAREKQKVRKEQSEKACEEVVGDGVAGE